MNRTSIYRLAAAGLLLGMAVHRVATARPTPGLAAYHARVRDAVLAAPERAGGWVGRDVEVPAQAVAVLAPNAIESRRYTDLATGTWAGFVLVHCRDAHDMAGHFPLRCYPAAGWVCTDARPRDWELNGRKLTSTEYRFHRGNDGLGGDSGEIVVVNFLMRPGGQVFRDMNGLAHSIIGAGGQSQGAGQVQVYFDAVTPAEQRDAATKQLLSAHATVLDAILGPVVSG